MSGSIRVVELFAGVGGFRVGLEAASDRFETVWANQWEPGRKNQFAADCYKLHFGEDSCVNNDINLVEDQVPAEFDLLVGGFPCQDYSVASTNAQGIQGKKGVLWWNIQRIVEKHKPKYVLLENVDRLLKSPGSQRGRDFGIILRCMADLGYSVEWRVINAADYGFVQKRRRTFIFCTRNDLPHYRELMEAEPEDRIRKTGFFAEEFPIKPTIVKGRAHNVQVGPTKYTNLSDVSDNFEAVFFNSGAMVGYEAYTRESESAYKGPCTTLEQILFSDTDPKYWQSENLDLWRYMKGAKRYPRTKRGTDFTYMYSEGPIPFPDSLDTPGRTMLTSEGSKNRSSHLVLRNGHYRTLTPVECERMNGFPDGWTDCMSDRQRYFTMGNALVVGLIEKMGREIARMD